jgi:CheY-like chemotaxis protein
MNVHAASPATTPSPDAESSVAAEPRERRLLLLAAAADELGTSAVRAAEAAGYEVERTADAGELLARLGEAGEAPETGAVLLVAGALDGDDRERQAREIGHSTAEAALPLVVIAGETPDAALLELGEQDHVTLLTPTPGGELLAAVLRGSWDERRRRRRVRELESRLLHLEGAGQREEILLARVGHELRNPLSAITTALSLMREMGDSDAHGQAERYRQIIERQVDLLRRAVDNLLDMAGIDSTPHPGVAEPRLPGEPGPAQPPLSGPGVLVVEDDPDGRAALSELLRLWGYSVTTADDGVAGVQHAEEVRPAVALVDIDLPGVDGYEVARRIRAAHPDSPPLLVAITGFGQPEDRQRALDAGFDRHLVKPVRPRDLAELLAKQAAAHAESGMQALPGPLPIETE